LTRCMKERGTLEASEVNPSKRGPLPHIALMSTF
jgi:hypothetical protein